MILDIFLRVVSAIYLLLFPGFIFCSPTSMSTKVIVTTILTPMAAAILLLGPSAMSIFEPGYGLYTRFIGTKFSEASGTDPVTHAKLYKLSATLFVLSFFQQRDRYKRINKLKEKFGFTDDPASWKDMTVEQAQEIEGNMAEWEFPRLFQFAWISDFLRVCTTLSFNAILILTGLADID